MYENISSAYQARNFIEKQFEKENMDRNNCINLQLLVEMVHKNQKTSNIAIMIAIISLIVNIFSNFILPLF